MYVYMQRPSVGAQSCVYLILWYLRFYTQYSTVLLCRTATSTGDSTVCNNLCQVHVNLAALWRRQMAQLPVGECTHRSPVAGTQLYSTLLYSCTYDNGGTLFRGGLTVLPQLVGLLVNARVWRS